MISRPTPRPRILPLCAALLLLSTAGLAAEDRWLYTRTENFEVLSAAPERRTHELVTALEQFRASFIETFSLRATHEPRVTVVIFDNDRRFTPYKPLHRGRPRDVHGYFIGGDDEAMIALKADVPHGLGDPTEIIFHEYVHFLLHTRDLRLPLWLNEGLAELFSTFRVRGDAVEYGHPKEDYVDILNQSPLRPISQLIATDISSPEYNEEIRAGMFYAQSWALTHFLVCSQDRSNLERLARFLDLLHAGTQPPLLAFQSAFGQDSDALGLKLRSYLDGGSYYLRRAPTPLRDIASRITLRPATELERDCALLNLGWRARQEGDTMLRALQLAERHPTSARPHEILANIDVAHGQHQRARERWQHAATLGTDNPFVYAMGAQGLLHEAEDLSELNLRLPADVVTRLRGWLDRAYTRSPLYEETLAALALLEARAPEFRIPVVNLIQGRVARFRNPHPTLLALALIRWRSQDAATAQEIAQAVFDSPRVTPPMKHMAQAMLARFSAKPESAKQPPLIRRRK